MPLGSLVPFLLAGLTPLDGRRRSDLVALTLSAFLCAMSLSRAAFSTEDTSRYIFASVASVALVAAASIRRSGTLATLVVVGVAVHVATYSGDWNGDVEDEAVAAARGLHRDASRSPLPGTILIATTETSRRTCVPGPRWPSRSATTGSASTSCATRPSRSTRSAPWDPGLAGRCTRVPATSAAYLRDSGVSYVVACDFDAPGCFYSRSHTRERDAAKVTSGLAPWAAAEADAEDAIQALPTVARAAFVGHGMTVVDLGAPPK